ncbi:conserved unknown protein [Ectocarpus siliculosus]|uniref:Uncharacterized protein n=1 Tax=Ectocarpus siliculosus TaxID=2880 RepID=D7FUN1_ECTSI|nr:conserved unknown protein [Ectocarpus siliculosus]|eukprot:CBJ31698.1 conserved unknown protein [Ectocarpus siliculosus]
MTKCVRKDSGSDGPATESTRSRVDGVIKDIISDHQGVVDKQIATTDIIRKELLRLYDKPKVSQLEAVLFKRITEDEARHILFLPDHDQAAHYPTLIANPPEGAPAEHPQRALQIPHLSLLYLHHLKRWDFVSAFVLSGGLHALCPLFTHDNLVVRMKAITSLVSITAHPGFDWFAPLPGRIKGTANNSNAIDARLHRALLGLRSEPAFISGLIANSWSGGAAVDDTDATAIEATEGGRGGKTFPGACLMCLELLAMWLSWVRALHTVDGTLRLSRPLFRAIEEWGGRGGEREGNIAWSERLPLPTLPHAKKTCGDGKAEGEGAIVVAKGEIVDVAAVGAAAVTEKGKMTPAAALMEKDSAAAAAEAAAAAAEGDGSSTGGRAPAGDLEAETAAMIQAERKERAEVLELSKKLVADFARFPPAEQEWEGVEEDDRGERSGGDLPLGGGAAAPTPTEEGKSSTAAGRGCCDDEARGSGDSGGREETSEAGEETRSSLPSEATEVAPQPPPTSVSTRKALALKLEGNEAFGEGQMQAAMEAYTKALGVLNGAATEARALEGAPKKTTTVTTTTEELEASRAEATALSGVLHRNRAAVALRLFNSKAAAAAAAGKERATQDNEKDEAAPRGGGVDDGIISSAAGCSQRQPSTHPTPSGRRRRVSPGRERRTQEEETDDVRRSLELSLALLEECESDCLRAIEVDAGDKKARLRLDKCRELRRRCYRGGLASASAGGEGCSTAHSRQDERLQGRKADLVAKILARAEKSHEITGGSGGSKKTTTPAATTAAATVPKNSSFSTASDGGSSHGTTAVSGNSGGGDANEALLAGASRHGARVESGGRGGDDCGDREGLPAAATTKGGAAPVLARQEDRMVSNGDLGKKTQKKKVASKEKKKKSGEHGQGNSASRSSRHGKADAVAVRSLRQRLEGVAARAAKTGTRQDGRDKREEEAAKEVWSVLAEGGVSLEKLFGDGITAEALVGVALGLRHGCGIDGGTSNAERASQLFVELSRVKRVGLVSAMCSADERLPLQDASDGIRRHHEESPKEHVGRRRPKGCGGGGGNDEEKDEALPQGCGGESRWSVFEAAVSTLGLSR